MVIRIHLSDALRVLEDKWKMSEWKDTKWQLSKSLNLNLAEAKRTAQSTREISLSVVKVITFLSNYILSDKYHGCDALKNQISKNGSSFLSLIKSVKCIAKYAMPLVARYIHRLVSSTMMTTMKMTMRMTMRQRKRGWWRWRCWWRWVPMAMVIEPSCWHEKEREREREKASASANHLSMSRWVSIVVQRKRERERGRERERVQEEELKKEKKQDTHLARHINTHRVTFQVLLVALVDWVL